MKKKAQNYEHNQPSSAPRLTDADAKYQVLFESANDAIVIMDREVIVDCNQNAADMLRCRREDVIGKPTNFFWPEYQSDGRSTKDASLDVIKAALQGNKTPFEWRHLRADGTYIDNHTTLNVFEWQGKKYLQAIIRDNTEIKRARDRMEAINQCWLSFGADPIKNINSLVSLCGRELMADGAFYNRIHEGKIVTVACWNQPPGYKTEDDAKGHICTDIVAYCANEIKVIRNLQQSSYSKSDPNVAAYGLKSYIGTAISFANRNIGALCVVYTRDVEPKENDLKLLGIIASAIGVEETRRQVILELYESEERFRLLIANSPDLIFSLDQNRRFIAVNENVAGKYGYSLADIIGKKFYDFIDERDRAAIRQYFQNFLDQKQESTRGVELRLMDKTGKKSWDFELNVNLQYDRQGNYQRTFGIARDITERKHLENQLLQAQKMEAIGTLAGGIAHDFNNLLMGIQGNASLMLLNTNPADPNCDRLLSIQHQVQSGSELTRQLLGFARGGKYNVRLTDIKELVQNSAELFGRTKKEISLYYNYQTIPCVAEVDRVQIEQVLLNIFVNAAQAMPGGGEILISIDKVKLEGALVESAKIRAGKYIKIAIQDTGIGMDEATKARIFEPFFTTKEVRHGAGLGLASAYGIIKNHKGTIEVESEKGRGTTLIIYLPASNKKPPEEKITDEEMVRGTETILLVDDEATIIDVTSDILKMLGYKILTASSGEEAIALYRKQQQNIDLIIMDMIMPVMGGGECFDILKEINPAVRVILSSGYSMTDRAQAIMNKGCGNFIQKPFSIKELSQKIRATLDQ